MVVTRVRDHYIRKKVSMKPPTDSNLSVKHRKVLYPHSKGGPIYFRVLEGPSSLEALFVLLLPDAPTFLGLVGLLLAIPRIALGLLDTSIMVIFVFGVGE